MRHILRLTVVAIAFGGATLAAAPAFGANSKVHVVHPGQLIQVAVNAAAPGDTIQLENGTYTGGILIMKDRLTITGAGPGTVIEPGTGNRCLTFAGETGICIIGSPDHRVSRVTISDLTVRNFPDFGVFGFFTDRMGVTGVTAMNNGEYGITQFESTRGSFIGNVVTGSTEEAGLYVGDIDDAHGTVVADNTSSANALGLLVRHARNVTVTGNTLVGNCTGLALVDDGQTGGEGDNVVRFNDLHANNVNCPAAGDVPPLQGTGIVLVGGDHNVITKNQVAGNAGVQAFSGGIVLVPGAPPAGATEGLPAAFNTVTNNVLSANSPADLIDASGSATNTFRHNQCGSSVPAGLCAS